MQELAVKTLDYFKENGLWTATPTADKDGNITGYNISQTSMSLRQYVNAKAILQGLNENGFTPAEQAQSNAAAQKKIQELDAGPKL